MTLLVTAVPTGMLKDFEQRLAAHRDRCAKLAINLTEAAGKLEYSTPFERVLAISSIKLAESEATAYAGLLDMLRDAMDQCPTEEFDL